MRGLHWELKAKEREAPLECQDHEVPVLAPRPVMPESTREFYVRRTDVEQYGPTPGCERCRTIAAELPSKGILTVECRERMKEHVQDAEHEGFAKYEENKIEAAFRKQVREEGKENLEEQQTKRRAKSAEAVAPQVQEQSSSSSAGEPTCSSTTKRKA